MTSTTTTVLEGLLKELEERETFLKNKNPFGDTYVLINESKQIELKLIMVRVQQLIIDQIKS